VKGHLIRLFPKYTKEIFEDAEADYRWRLIVSKKQLAKVLTDYILHQLKYDNFKAMQEPDDPDAHPKHGDFIIAKIPKADSLGDDGEATFKRLVFDGPNVYLKAENKAYPLIDVTGKWFIIVGVVKAIAEKTF